MTADELTVWLGALAKDAKATQSAYTANKVIGCPIPFFGNVLNARVLTVGVNPSNTEFDLSRKWSEAVTVAIWQERLLNYFLQPAIPSHRWFETWSICLELLEVSYAGSSAAHIDISPRATAPMLDKATNKPLFRAMVEQDVKWFFELLSNLSQVQLLLVAGPIPRANGGKQQLADFIREHGASHGATWGENETLPKLVTTGHPNGIPVFVCPHEPNVDGLYAMVRQVYRNRDLLRRLSAPPKSSVSILPESLDWPSAVGNFVVNFSTLDYLVFVFLKDHLSTNEFAKIQNWHCKDRVNRIAQHLKDAAYPTEQQAEFEQLVERLKPIRDLRNHIAHGYMHNSFDADPKKRKFTLFQAKDLDTEFLPGSKHVEFAELLDALSKLNELIEEFQRLAGFEVAASATIVPRA